MNEAIITDQPVLIMKVQNRLCRNPYVRTIFRLANRSKVEVIFEEDGMACLTNSLVLTCHLAGVS
ncbi:MAG: hypothetical protein ABH824_03835, partial [Nanoarchaeota archaeon]|nr:hypothetical protein [Nanoarchaeota archaeon]MBU1631817.1 hypothetical protein [Nanoarchaeota archaeon]MBU1875608.1 hypothetical protein [Nanoarchaeota archaeon]